MKDKFVIEKGLVYVPRFVRQESDMEYGSIVTHENYNEKLNLNTTQGDYNTEILRLWCTEPDPKRVPHIVYLDKIIEDEVNRIDGVLEDHQKQIDEVNERVDKLDEDFSELSKTVNNIITGVQKVGHALQSDKITGVDECGPSMYYGTDTTNKIGFHKMPPAIFAEDINGKCPEVDGIYFTPRPDSVDESMLTPDLRDKLNRETLSDYTLLTNKPKINNVTLLGNLSLDDLGIQPKGNYLTSIPSNYPTSEDVSKLLQGYLTTTTADNTYAKKGDLNTTNNNLNALTTVVNNFQTTANGKFAVVCLNNFSGTPKVGDILITL